MHCGGGVAVRRTPSEPSLTKRVRLTSLRVLVTAGGCTTHLLRVDVLVFAVRRTGASVKATPEKRCCALMPVFSIERVVPEDTPRSFQTRGRGSHAALGDGAPSRGAGEPVQATARAPGRGSRCSPHSLGCIDKEGTSGQLSPSSAS